MGDNGGPCDNDGLPVGLKLLQLEPRLQANATETELEEFHEGLHTSTQDMGTNMHTGAEAGKFQRAAEGIGATPQRSSGMDDIGGPCDKDDLPDGLNVLQQDLFRVI